MNKKSEVCVLHNMVEKKETKTKKPLPKKTKPVTEKIKKEKKEKEPLKMEEAAEGEKKEITEKEGEELMEERKYFEAVGRRKTAIARVRLFGRGEKVFSVNGKSLEAYFQIPELIQVASSAMKKMRCDDKFKVTVKVKGGGLHAQAEAIRHATTRALVLFNPEFRKRLKRAGYLTRDARMRERKKFGLKRARRAPQWAKR